jgi:phosphoglycolate phosphatase-like HAD superfamily hydrolase
MNFKLAIFDMDGVILDSMGQLTDLAVKTIGFHFGLSENIAREKYLSTVGLPFVKQIEMLFPNEPPAAKLMAVAIYEARHRELCPDFPLAPEAHTVVKGIQVRSSVALVTSTHRSLLMNYLPQVRALGFDYLGGFRDGISKSHQIGAAMGVTGNTPEETIYFGDSETDGFYASESGVAFRMLTCANLASALGFMGDRVWK